MTVIYEWDVETVETYDDGNNDVHDHHHTKTFAEAKAFAATTPPEGCTHEIVLVRDDDDRRSWAYLNEDGTIPSHFYDANEGVWGKVPARYHKEVARANPFTRLRPDRRDHAR